MPFLLQQVLIIQYFNKYQIYNIKEDMQQRRIEQEEIIQRIINTIVSQQAHIKKNVQGKTITMFVGDTGVGKSTLISALLGKKLKSVKGVFLPQISEQNTKIFTPQIAVNSTQSYTSKISIWKTGELLETGLSPLICDSPGFEDTRGYERDIINCYSIQKTIQVAKNIKIILVFTSADLKNLNQRLRKIIKQISKGFRVLDKNKLAVCVTKTQRTLNQVDVKKKISQFLKQMLEAKDKPTEEEIKLYEFLIKECQIFLFPQPEKQEEELIIPAQTRNKILNIGCNSIKEIKHEYFKFISSQSKGQIHEKITQIDEQIAKFCKDYQNSNKCLLAMNTILDQLYRGRITPDQALRQIDIQVSDSGAFKVIVGGTVYQLGAIGLRYGASYLLLTIGTQVVAGTLLAGCLSVLTFLAGPIGIGLTLVTVGGTAVYKYRKRVNQNRQRAFQNLKKQIEAINNIIKMDITMINKLREVTKKFRNLIK